MLISKEMGPENPTGICLGLAFLNGLEIPFMNQRMLLGLAYCLLGGGGTVLALRQLYPNQGRRTLRYLLRAFQAWLAQHPVRRKPGLSRKLAVAFHQEQGSDSPGTDRGAIRVLDGYGREVEVPRTEWRAKVLPEQVSNAWNNPEDLCRVILEGVQQGFCSEMLAAARQLYGIDPDRGRATGVYSSLLMQQNRLDKAQKVLRHHLNKHGPNALVLMNLAKIYANRKNGTKACELLTHALEVDPNLETGLSWYLAIHQERGGEPAALEACQRMARLPGSWRARLYLARTALVSGDLDRALSLYRESIQRAGTPVPGDLLLKMSGDLAQFAHLPELLNLTLPCFDARLHGVLVAAKLIQAYLDLGQIEQARKLLDQLYALKRPHWARALSVLEEEIANAKVAVTTIDEASSMELIRMEGVVWLDPISPAAELFPVKLQDGPEICFLGFTGTSAQMEGNPEHRVSDELGHCSRMLPLFLAEQVEFQTDARVLTLVPWMHGEAEGFIFSGKPWPEGQVPQLAGKADYAVVCHWNTLDERWRIELSLVRTIDRECLKKVVRSFHREKAGEVFHRLAGYLIQQLEALTAVQRRGTPSIYQVPSGRCFIPYLRRVEQLLAARCGVLAGGKPDCMAGEREMLDGAIHLCVEEANNIPARIVLAQLLLTVKKVRPCILPEYPEKIALLQAQKPLEEPAHSVLQRVFDMAFSG